MNLEALRHRIDQLDIQLVELLNRRATLVQKVGEIKKSAHRPVCEPVREAVVFKNVFQANKGPLSQNHIHHIYLTIIEVMRDMQVVHDLLPDAMVASSSSAERNS